MFETFAVIILIFIIMFLVMYLAREASIWKRTAYQQKELAAKYIKALREVQKQLDELLEELDYKLS